jgi:synaptic vesicle membrane protein VAT-1
MKKVVIAAFGDESNLAIVESNLPDPVSAEVQLSVEYTIVSGSDVNMRRGTYPLQKKPPLTPGYSVIGKVRLNGQDCSKFKTAQSSRSVIASHVFRSTRDKLN